MTEPEQLIDELTYGDDRRAEAAVHELTKFGERAAEMLQKLYHIPNSDEEVRWWALRAITEIPSEHSKATLIAGLKDENSGVRYCAALGLREQPAAQAIPHLVGLLSSSDKLLARLASDALIHTGKDAVPALIAVAEDGHQSARVEAVRALSRIGDKRSISGLFDVLEEDSAMLEYWANEGLEKMGVGMVFYEP